MKLLLFLILLQSPADIYKSATADMDAGRYAEAAPKFERVLKDDPTHIPSEFSLAVCYTKMDKPESAIPLYRKILEQDSEIYEARFNLGILLQQAGDESGADEEFRRASAMRPQDPHPLLYHAAFLEKRGDLEEALKTYDRARAADPADKDAESAAAQFRRRLGSEYRKAGKFDKAVEVLSPLGMEKNPELAWTYYEKKDFEKAAAAFQALATADASNPDYLYMLGRCRMELKQYPQAVTILRQALKLKPDDTEALRSLASTYQLQQDWANAAAVIERFIQLKPRDAYAYFMLATAYDRLQNVKQAWLNYNKFLELDDGSNDPRSFQARERAKTLERHLKKPR